MSEPRRLTVRDIMTAPVVTSGPDDDLSGVAAEMRRHRIGSVVIMENQKIVGILTERDFVRIVEQVGTLLKRNLAKHYMAKPVITVQLDTSIANAIKLMRKEHVRHLIVLNKDLEMVGVISSRDLMKNTGETMEV
jgi:CBS domain-containing protein